MKASVLIAVSLHASLEICLNTFCKRDLLLCLMAKVVAFGFVHRVLLWFLWFMRPRAVSINVPARCCLQWHYRKTAWVQSRQHMCFNNINFRSSVLEAVKTRCVPKCAFRSLYWSSQFCIVCATPLLVQLMWWWLLCPVGPGWDW